MKNNGRYFLRMIYIPVLFHIQSPELTGGLQKGI